MILFVFSSCSMIAPEAGSIVNDIEKMVDDDAIKIKIDRDSIEDNEEVHVHIDVKKK
jgi:hypothetical protein